MENLEIVWNNITPIQRFYLLIDEVKLPEHEADKIKKIEFNSLSVINKIEIKSAYFKNLNKWKSKTYKHL